VTLRHFSASPLRDDAAQNCRQLHGIHQIEEDIGAMQSNEDRLQHDVACAERARAVLDNAALTDAFAALEQSYVEAWRTTRVDDVAGREKLFLAVNIVGKVRDQLARAVADGALAQRELKHHADEIARACERKRRFGIV
jgi:hypothetical protein